MREILFRGKAECNNKWRIGWYQPPFDYKWESTDGEVRHSDATIFFLNDAMRPDWVVVDEATVGQYTGLTDKNGKKIFEGDVIVAGMFGRKKKYRVEMDNDRRGWYPFAAGDGCGCCEDETFYPGYCEVIGNIHDNPELIGGNESWQTSD